ncbi:MAG: hypothetical protein HC897_16385 [Thermoanaerobaculia bacterium]|nr:hypothetical protein [Thermoanaerobaculia bacterium]
MDPASALHDEHFLGLREQIKHHVHQGHLDAALELCDQAVAWTQGRGDHQAADLATCNRASVLVALGRGDEVLRELQAILLRSFDPVNRFAAAYDVAKIFDVKQNFSKSLFYARLALENALKSSDHRLVTRAHNLVGNTLVAESYFEDALSHYVQALAVNTASELRDRMVILGNAGYCQIILGQYREGFRSLFQGLRAMRRINPDQVGPRIPLHLSLAFGYLELGRYQRSRAHAALALGEAERIGDRELVKKALYILGEAMKLVGEDFKAYRLFARLRDEFFPDHHGLADLLMATETHKLINLMA